MDAVDVWLPFAFFFIALLYASVGFGGGSSYLAVLVLTGLPYHVVPQTALVCNLIVSGGGVWHFRRAGYFRFERILPRVVLSVPMAFVGGRMDISERAFMMLLGVSLLVAGARVFISSPQGGSLRQMSRRQAWLVGLPVGGALGFLAGIVGIGGGVFLAPVLLLTGWCNAKEAAATAALFIVVNSAAGLAGQLAKGMYLDQSIIPLALAVMLGGQIGSRLGAYHLPLGGVRRLLGTLIVLVSVRLLWGAV